MKKTRSRKSRDTVPLSACDRLEHEYVFWLNVYGRVAKLRIYSLKAERETAQTRAKEQSLKQEGGLNSEQVDKGFIQLSFTSHLSFHS